MSTAIETRAISSNRPALPRTQPSVARAARVRPSIVDSLATEPFTLDQELKQFGTWVDKPVWVPPKDSSDKMAKSMLHHASWFASREKRWNDVIARHRDSFTQVREIEMTKASIRLPLYAAKDISKAGVQAAIFAPRVCTQFMVNRRQKALDAYRSKLEFQRRRTALRAVKAHHQCRSHDCTFDEMLALTNPLETGDVIRQYGIEKQLTPSRQDELLHIAAGVLPWFTAFSLGLSGVASITMLFLTPLPVCDPAFVAEFPEQPGVLWNIGHFDEINGVRHVEI